MAPRSYILGKRAATSAETRRRVLEAAAALYREVGAGATTIRAVAERADVSRGTVLNHFGSADGLLEALLDAAVAEIQYPDERILEGAQTAEERIRRYVDAMFRFFDRSTDWWQVFAADTQLPAVQERERAYWQLAGQLLAATLGSIAGDRIATAALAAFVDWGLLGGLRNAGLSLDEAVEVVGDALVDLVAQRETAARSSSDRST